METLIRVLETALPVFLTLAIGMLCRSKNILSRAGVDQLKSVAVNICLPAVLISSFATAEYTKNSITVPLVIFAICSTGRPRSSAIFSAIFGTMVLSHRRPRNGSGAI